MRAVGLKFCCRIWLGRRDLFQTFEDLDSVEDKVADVQAIRQILTDDTTDCTDGEEQ